MEWGPIRGQGSARPRTAVILQSSYLPWIGYFDQMNSADVFVLYDTVQYTKRDWRNRNRIVSRAGPFWLTIPVRTKGRFHQRVCDVEVADPAWAQEHWRSIALSYGRAPHFRRYADELEALYQDLAGERFLSAVNARTLRFIASHLGIQAPLIHVDDICVPDEGHEVPCRDLARNLRLVALCQAVGARRYVTGPAALVYLRPDVFLEHGIEVRIARYPAYPAYPRLGGEPSDRVSALDLLMMTGADACRHLHTAQSGNGFLEPVSARMAG